MEGCFGPGAAGQGFHESLDSLSHGQHRIELELVAIHRDLQGVLELLSRPGQRRSVSALRPSLLASQLPVAEKVTEELNPVGSVASEVVAYSSHAQSLRSCQSFATASIRDRRASDLSVAVLPPSLPCSWPACLEPRHGVGDNMAFGSCDSMMSTSVRLASSSSAMLVLDEEEENVRSRFTCDPSSNFSVGYGFATLLVLVHDAFMVPWALAWEVQLQGVVLVLTCFSCIFWTFDVFLGFFFGYYYKQRLELQLSRTVWHHFRTWFLPDLCVVLTDWFSIIPALISDAGLSTNAVSRVLRFAKAGKLMRLFGLLRMMKLVKIFEDYIEGSLSEPSRLALRLLQFLWGIIWMCHAISCIWFSVGKVEGDTGMRWTYISISQETPKGEKEVDFRNFSLLHQYVTALHWSLAQVSLGATEIACYNSTERIFNCVCILIGLIGGSTLVSSLSATMVDYQQVRKEETDELVKLRRYLRENRRKVAKSTALLIQQQAAERLKLTDRLQEKDVRVLELVSSTLRKELRYEIFLPMLTSHGLLHIWVLLDRSTTQRACLEALEYRHYRPLDEVFLGGTRTDCAYHLSNGTLDYIKEPETAPVLDKEAIEVPDGAWLAEASLWSAWIHVGTARANTSCDVLQVPAHAVSMMLRHRPEVRSITLQYASRFYQQIVSSLPPAAPYPDDLEIAETGFEEMVTSLHPDLQQQLSLQMIALSGKGALRKLKREVKAGRCCVALRPDGAIERTVCWVVLQLQDAERRLFVELAKSAGDGFVASGELPKKQVEPGEIGRATLKKVFRRVGLEENDDFLIWNGSERSEELKHTQDFGCATRTVQHVHKLFLKNGSVPLALLAMTPQTPNQPADESSLRELVTEVFVDQKQRHVYAWLTAAVFDYLQTSSGERELRSWLETLNLEGQLPSLPSVGAPTPTSLSGELQLRQAL